MCPADTSPEAGEVFLEIQWRLSSAEKLCRALELWALVRGAAEAGCAPCTRLRASVKSFPALPAWHWEKSCSNKPRAMPSRPMNPLSSALR